jgi:hypothetical protein
MAQFIRFANAHQIEPVICNGYGEIIVPVAAVRELRRVSPVIHGQKEMFTVALDALPVEVCPSSLVHVVTPMTRLVEISENDFDNAKKILLKQ